MATKAVSQQTTENPVSQSIRFCNESVDELKKVHTPSKEQTIQTSIRVLIMVILFAGFLGLTDYLVGNVMQSILT